jgi:hypothetical protein
MRRDGWGKAQADYRIKSGGSDASVFVFGDRKQANEMLARERVRP